MKKYLLKREDIHRGDLILVNDKHPIVKEIDSSCLKMIYLNYPNILLEKTVQEKLQQVLDKIDGQEKIVPVSGYRSLEEQRNIYETSLNENGEEFTKKYVAYPNTSEHQTGLAIDLGIKIANIDLIRPSFPRTGIGKEFRKIAYQYGFIERYQDDKESITHIASEEWHFRYVGYPHSSIMKKLNFCLEEYIEFLKNFPYPKSSFFWKNYKISYFPMNQDKQKIMLRDKDRISGNNIDGFIIMGEK